MGGDIQAYPCSTRGKLPYIVRERFSIRLIRFRVSLKLVNSSGGFRARAHDQCNHEWSWQSFSHLLIESGRAHGMTGRGEKLGQIIILSRLNLSSSREIPSFLAFFSAINGRNLLNIISWCLFCFAFSPTVWSRIFYPFFILFIHFLFGFCSPFVINRSVPLTHRAFLQAL